MENKKQANYLENSKPNVAINEVREKTKKNSKNKGITLIALVVTIVVLLILAGVSITVLFGDSGIITMAQKAAGETQKAEEKDQKELEDLNKYLTSENWGGSINPTDPENKTITKTDSYVGCYADMDGNGSADGIIYADLAVGGRGEWADSRGTYKITKCTEGLKDYYIAQDKYQGDFYEETKPMIAPVKEDTRKKRFYIMELEDFNKGTKYCWYDNANGKLDNIIEASVNDFEKGKENTDDMIKKWNTKYYGEQNCDRSHLDLWGVIQNKAKEGWFVPSKTEWAAFAGELKITNENYMNHKLSDGYWSSSQAKTTSVHNICFNQNGIIPSTTGLYYRVRLSTTF